MKIILLLLIKIVLVALLMLCITLLNLYSPIRNYETSIGITFHFGLVVLLGSLFLTMMCLFFSKKKVLHWLPMVIPMYYWYDQVSVFPHRSWAILIANIVFYAIYIYIARELIK